MSKYYIAGSHFLYEQDMYAEIVSVKEKCISYYMGYL